ncbi:HpcH/HpaI aldolase family protein [Elioraea sp.]|uniref:HpcH/HpaI aldolase family protein n=1 Tax=Elioraea sp. TaxID=2185103 RepID=UPI003F7181D7
MSASPAARFRATVAAGGIALGSNVRFSRSPEIGAMLAECGFAWMMLDFEHSPMTPHLAYDIALGAIRAGMLPLARPASHDPREIAGLLTNGALGVLAPHVDTPEQAEAVARACRFAPRGQLSVPGSLPQFGYGLKLAEACARFNDEVVVVAMIESAPAVENVAAIAATEGIDGIFIGASDLLWDLGLPGGYESGALADAITACTTAAGAVGKFVGLGGPPVEAVWRAAIAAGVRMVLTENDMTLLLRGARDRAGFFAGLDAAARAVPLRTG